VVVAQINTLCVVGKFLREDLPVAGVDDASRDPDPAIGAVELDPVLLAIGIYNAAAPCTGRSAFTGVDDTIGVSISHFVLAGRGEAAGDHVD